MGVSSILKVWLKLSILGIDLYEIKSDDEEEKLKRAFALVRDNKDLMKEFFDLFSKSSFKSVVAVGEVQSSRYSIDDKAKPITLCDIDYEEGKFLENEKTKYAESLHKDQGNTAIGGAAAYHGNALYVKGDCTLNTQSIFYKVSFSTSLKRKLKKEINENPAKKRLRISIQDLFESKDACDKYINNVENELSFELYSAPELLRYYGLMIQTDKFDKAKKFGKQLLDILTSVEISPQEAYEYACQLHEEKPLKSLFFHFFAMHLCLLNDEITPSLQDLMTSSMEEIAGIVETMVFEKKLSKHIVHQHIVRTLICFKSKLIKTFDKTPIKEERLGQFADLNANQCFFISRCQLVVHDYIGSERTLKEAIQFYKKAFSHDLSQAKSYGVILHCLGRSLLGRGQKEEAKECFKDAGKELFNTSTSGDESKTNILKANEKFFAQIDI